MSRKSAKTIRRQLGKEQRFKLEYAYPLPSDFPQEFEKICRLIARETQKIGAKEVQLRLGEIVYRYRDRFSDPQYFDRIRECINAANCASENIGLVFKRFVGLDIDKYTDAGNNPEELKHLKRIDIDHIQKVMSAINNLSPRNFPIKGYLDLLKHLKEIQLILMVLSAALILGTVTTVTPRERGRPRLPYVFSTLDLIEAWEDMMGTKVVSPKGTVAGKKGQLEAAQPSTEFVRLGLRMIKDEITTAEAMTSIKNALKLREQIKKLEYKAQGKGFFHALRILTSPNADFS
jgi:hypothetical protein